MKSSHASPRTPSASLQLALEVFAWRHGWICLVTIAAAVALGAVVTMLMNPLQTQLGRARQERIDLSAQLADLTLRPATASTADADLSLEAVLPTAADGDRHIQAIYTTADRHGLRFTNSVLRTTDNPKAGVSRTEITLPVRGTYPRIAAFVESLLLEQPHLSVDQLRFRRDNVAASEGEAEIRISCWMQSASASSSKSARESAS
ncbi:MAG: GspMb/PilO family protein [Pseudomonadota bacterium]|nr:GspMb/PilO family protein [Pseudomonadota bacterium]